MNHPLPAKRPLHEVVHMVAANEGSQSFFRALQRFGGNLWRNKNLTYQLYKRDLLGNYRKSVLGLMWILLSPMIGAISWSFMVFAGVLNPGDTEIPYTAYVLLSGSLWSIFAGVAASTSETLETNRGFISQIYFPHEILFVKQAGSALSSASITFGLNLIVSFFFGVIPSWKLIFFPFLVMPLVVLACSIGFLVSLFSAIATDIRRVSTLVIGMLMFATPVVYVRTPENETLAWLVEHNPLTILIRFPREVILFGEASGLETFLMTASGCFLLFTFSLRFFFSSEPSVIERLF